MASLNDAHRAYIIDHLACFGTLDEVAAALKDIFGLDVPKSTILRYDPTTVQGSKELSGKWKEAFAERRKTFLADVSAIPIANKAVRLKRLDDLSRTAMVMKNPVQLRATIEQAAKEAADFYAPRGASGRAGAEEGELTHDADTEAAERSTRLDAILDVARARRDREDPSQGAEGSNSPAGASG